MSGRLRYRSSLACGLALIAMFVVAPSIRSAPTATDLALVPGGGTPDFFLLFTGDVIGYLDPCG